MLNEKLRVIFDVFDVCEDDNHYDYYKGIMI